MMYTWMSLKSRYVAQKKAEKWFFFYLYKKLKKPNNALSDEHPGLSLRLQIISGVDP